MTIQKSFLFSVFSVALFNVSAASAADFTVINGQTVTTEQTLSAGETGTIDAGGALTLSSGSNNGASFTAISSSQNNTITNSGAITVTGGQGNPGGGGTGGTGGNAVIINSSGNNNTFTNTGTLTATGGNGGPGTNGGDAGSATVVLFSGTGNTFTNQGTVNANGGAGGGAVNTPGSGGDATAILFSGTGNTFENEGTVNAGVGGAGIRDSGGNGGSTAGAATAITVTGANTTITNSGTIDGDINASNASDFTLIVQSGSNITGDVDVTGATNTVIRLVSTAPSFVEGGGFASTTTAPNITGGALNTNYTIENTTTGASVVPSGAVLVTSGGQTLAVTPDVFAGAEQVVINQSAVQAGNLITQRQQLALIGSAQQTSATGSVNEGISAGDAAEENRLFWTEGFGSYRERPANGDAAFSRTRSGGVLAGVDLPENVEGYSYGFYVGGFAGEQAIGETSFRRIDSRGALVGAYAGRSWGDYYVTAQLAVGYSNHDSGRNVGADIARADYDSFFVSPSLSIMRAYTGVWDGVTLVPSATVRYTGQYTSDYTEEGSAANQTVESRDTHTIGGRAIVEAHFNPRQSAQGTFTSVLRAGIEGQTNIGGNDVDLTVLSTDVSLDPKGGDDTLDGVIGMNLSYDLTDGPELYFDGEVSLGINQGGISDNKGGALRIGARWTF